MRKYLKHTGWRGELEWCWMWAVRIAGLTVAALWRTLLFRTTVIAITGSVGKTTAKDCIAATLATRGRTARSYGTSNSFRGITRTILRIMPFHRYAVVEVGIDGPGQMKWFARVVRPDVAVWLGVARTHTDALPAPEARAAEKRQLLDSVRAGGTVVVHAGDPFAAQYEAKSGRAIVRFGDGPGSTLYARNAVSRWPEKLAFDLHSGASPLRVQTSLNGTHWLPSVLSAFAVASACGVDAEAAAQAIAAVRPYTARLSDAPLPGGAVFLRDENNGSEDTLRAAFDVMREARAERRLLVMSDISDSTERPRQRMARIGRACASVFDWVLFVGEHSERAARAAVAGGLPPENVVAAYSLEHAIERLRAELRPGDLVLLRGRHTDHLSRIWFALHTDVDCMRVKCGRRGLCDDCPELRRAGVWRGGDSA